MANKIVQLDMFRTQKDEEEVIFKKSVEKSIRGLFSRYTENCVMIEELHRRFDRLSEDLYKFMEDMEKCKVNV